MERSGKDREALMQTLPSFVQMDREIGRPFTAVTIVQC